MARSRVPGGRVTAVKAHPSIRGEVAIVIVTHNLQQAYRIADHVGLMYLGELVEYGPAEQVFGNPTAKRTREYVAGTFG